MLLYDQYRFKFYFNASHAIYLKGQLGESHPHTWELILHGAKTNDNFVPFDEIEKMIEGFLSRYQDVFINTVPPFTTINPTLESICTYFKGKLQEMLHEKGWLLLSIELSETPTRAYVISMVDEVQARKQNSKENDKENGREIKEDKMQDVVDQLAVEKLNLLLNMQEASATRETEEEE